MVQKPGKSSAKDSKLTSWSVSRGHHVPLDAFPMQEKHRLCSVSLDAVLRNVRQTRDILWNNGPVVLRNMSGSLSSHQI
jgi:hypothetical protein